ncbi:MAG: tripartite tricarboxylate transporter TctB family protein [Rhodospirillales bacterium]
MTEKTISGTPRKKPLGGELVIPVCSLAFTLYYFSTIIDSPWTAQVSAFFVGAILIALSLTFVVKTLYLVKTDRANFGLNDLIGRTDITSGRIWVFLLTLGYVVLVDLGGFTLTTFVFLFSSMLILNKGRRPGFIALMAAGFALGGYGLFIVALETRFPSGPFEKLMQSVM